MGKDKEKGKNLLRSVQFLSVKWWILHIALILIVFYLIWNI